MVLRNWGRTSNKEKCKIGGKHIEVVSRYKYLGVTLTPQLKFRDHLNEKLSLATFRINNIWKNFIPKNEIILHAKFLVFNSVLRSMIGISSANLGFSGI